MSKREPENLIRLLPDNLSDALKQCDIVSVENMHENCLCMQQDDGLIIPATKDLVKTVKNLENKERKFINDTLARYYNTRDKSKFAGFERDIDNLEQIFYNRYAWKIVRVWEKERSR